jgi:hypothetical protein
MGYGLFLGIFPSFPNGKMPLEAVEGHPQNTSRNSETVY